MSLHIADDAKSCVPPPVVLLFDFRPAGHQELRPAAQGRPKSRDDKNSLRSRAFASSIGPLGGFFKIFIAGGHRMARHQPWAIGAPLLPSAAGRSFRESTVWHVSSAAGRTSLASISAKWADWGGRTSIFSGVVVTAASQCDWPKPCGEICTDRSPLWRRLRPSTSSFPQAWSPARRRNPYQRCPASGS